MNIVLDMDQTLIDGVCSTKRVIERPHLELFLEWCFKTFDGIGIWTAANQAWFDYVNEKVFEPMLQRISEKNGATLRYQFDFVFAQDKCTNVWRYSEWHGHSVLTTEKRLRKLHRSKERFKQYTVLNTLMIDDTKTTFGCNYGNGIHIPPFEADEYTPNWRDDNALLKLRIYLRNVVIPHYKKYNTVRNLEKRYWISYVNELKETGGGGEMLFG